MTDVHCHLQFKAFETDYDKIIQDAFAAGITRIINVGTKIDSSRKAVEFAEKYEELYAIIGVHPHHADKHDLESDWLSQLEKLANHKKVLAIGEIGLDYFSYQSNGIVDPKLQKKVFIEQINLAHKLNLPLQIHNRHAGEDILDILESNKHLLLDPPGMFHCFAGSREVLKRALNLGFCIGFDGNITYKGLAPGETVSLSELATLTPLDRIVIETDSPYLTPVPYRGKRNEPKHAIITATFVANLKKIPLEDFVAQTEKNIYNIFRL
jgi:TatD DNase family protein